MTPRERKELLNWVVNEPTVLAALAPGYSYVDMGSFVDDSRNIMLGNETSGLVLFAFVAPGVYDLHYALTLRGRDALKAVRMALHDVFTKHHAHVIVGATPRDNRAARAMNRALGARPTGVCTDTLGRACIIYKLERSTWAASSAVSLAG